MSDSRPKDNIRLLLHLWLEGIEVGAKSLLPLKPEDPEMAAKSHAYNLEMGFVQRVRHFLQEHPRP